MLEIDWCAWALMVVAHALLLLHLCMLLLRCDPHLLLLQTSSVIFHLPSTFAQSHPLLP